MELLRPLDVQENDDMPSKGLSFLELGLELAAKLQSLSSEDTEVLDLPEYFEEKDKSLQLGHVWFPWQLGAG